MNNIKILIVEDEPIVALDIERTLGKLGYEITDNVTNYDAALSSVDENEPDIIFMDINLTNSKSGIEIVKEINKTKNIPVIYLTAFSDDETMNQAIQTNPINYILKPFKREDLKSSILLSLYKIQNNKKSAAAEKYFEVGSNYYYDLNSDNLYYIDQPIHLSKNEKKLLRLLIEAQGNIVTVSQIQDEVWDGKPISSSAYRTLLYRLRSKFEFKLIETIPSFGCKLKI